MRTVITNSEGCYPCTYFELNDYKPKGFWYSINGEWEWFCKDNYPDGLDGENIMEIEVDLSRVLVLDNIIDLERFYEQYRITGDGMAKRLSKSIDWREVKLHFKGIEFRNYWDHRDKCSFELGFMWYYQLDCSCGCIWDTSIVNVKNISSNVLR